MIPRMRGMRPEDVYALEGVSDPRLDPDGQTVAYAHWSVDGDENEYRANIWLAPVDGSEPPRRFTTGERRDGEPRWSPDGSRMAFVSSRAEKEPGQLYVISAARRGGAEADEAQGGRPERRLVARRLADRVRLPRPRRVRTRKRTTAGGRRGA